MKTIYVLMVDLENGWYMAFSKDQPTISARSENMYAAVAMVAEKIGAIEVIQPEVEP